MLVRLSRNSVKEYLETGKTIQAPKDFPRSLYEHYGVFVTINKINKGKGILRGCIGFPYPTGPLVEVVIGAAINSATRDPRFQPISLPELNQVVFEVSILTKPEFIEVKKPEDYLAEIKVGEDGLIIERGIFKGLLLPQVPVEWGWREEDFLCQCCMKAGLPLDSWIDKDTKVYRFKAIVFEEEAPSGTIKRKKLSCE